jgi:transcription elongation factor GreA
MTAEMMTAAGLERLKAELDRLIRVERPEISQRIHDAIALGDLSENADYENAKHHQAFIEGRIAELTARIRNAELIVETADKTTVTLGSHVTIESDFGLETYTILGSSEADPARGVVSHVSPLGRALLGRRVGEQARFATPGGEFVCRVVEIA